MTMKERPAAGIPDWTLGNRLQRALTYLRERTGEVLTATQMGVELGVDRATISRWMHDRGPVRAVYLRQWALRTGVSYEWLSTGRASGPGTPNPGVTISSGWTRRRRLDPCEHAGQGRLRLAS